MKENPNIVITNSLSGNGFLSGFIEASVEMPPDGLNGECVVHYGGEHNNCELDVRLSKGLKEGIGTILKDGVPFIQIEYHNGVPNGPVCRMDDCGMVELRGELMNGMECGLFVEYDDSKKVVWRGYYRNGKRYSEVMKSKRLEGYYDEKSVVSGSLLSIAQYDDSLQDKYGSCYEYENGSLKNECVYENGVKKRTVREFVNGKMIVYNSNGKKVYEGVYYGDMKSGFLCHEPMEGMAGYFKEVDSNGQLIIVSQYDELNVYRNGKCFELENGKVKRLCLYENGEMNRVIQEFNGSTMIEYDLRGQRVYEGGFKGDMKSGFVRDGFGKEYIVVEEKVKSISEPRIEIEKKRFLFGVREIEHKVPEMEHVSTTYREKPVTFGHWKNGKKNGMICDLDEDENVIQGCWYEDGEMKRVVEEWELSIMLLSMRINNCLIDYMKSVSLFIVDISTGTMHGSFQLNNRYFSVDWLEDYSQSIMVDMDSKEMIVYRNGERISTQYTIEVLDLDTNGRRWEGGVKNGKPFGYGVIYDEEGKKEYEGFMLDGMKCCYGIEYYSDIERMKYEGGYYDDKRFGKGVLYDRYGDIDYDGLWKNDAPYSSQFDGNTIDNHTESIVIPNNSFNQSKSFILRSFLHSLKRIVIGGNCFGSVRVFELDGLSELESVVIGKKSFTYAKTDDDIWNNKRTDGVCRIVNCPKLKSIQIGNYSFSDYHSFELNNLPSLQSIDLGNNCFHYAPSFSLTGLFD